MKILIAALLLVVCTFSQARADQTKKLRNDAKALVSAALAQGLQKVNGFSVNKILVELESPRMIMNKHLGVNFGSRVGGAYQFSENANDQASNWVMINPAAYAATPTELRAPWMLHELLGVLRYPDHEYSMTLQIYFAAQGLSSNSLIKEMIREHNPIELAGAGGGSGTSGGGGGDPLVIQMKIQVLERLNALLAQGPTYKDISINRLAQLTLDCGFEFFNGTDAVQHEDYVQSFYEFATQQTLDVPWSILHVRRGWYKSPTATDGRPHLDVLMDGVVLAGQSDTKVLCHDPGRGFTLQSSPPSGH